MNIFATSAHTSLKNHIQDIKDKKNGTTWRCFVTRVSRDLYWDPYANRILLNFIEEHYKDFEVYEFAFYFLKTGHIFLLFQGRMKKAYESFEYFLDFVSEGEGQIKPSFELYDMGKQIGWVEDVFEEAMEDIRAEQKLKKQKLKSRKTENEKSKTAKDKNDKNAEKRDRSTLRAMRLKPILLLVEDERMTQAFIEAMIEPYCDVIIADTIERGRRMYDQHWPNMVMMDINLPDGSGQDLTQEICEKDPGAYVVMVSAHSTSENIEHCMNLGAKGFVAKPVTSDKERLLSMINHYNRDRQNEAH